MAQPDVLVPDRLNTGKRTDKPPYGNRSGSVNSVVGKSGCLDLGTRPWAAPQQRSVERFKCPAEFLHIGPLTTERLATDKVRGNRSGGLPSPLARWGLVPLAGENLRQRRSPRRRKRGRVVYATAPSLRWWCIGSTLHHIHHSRGDRASRRDPLITHRQLTTCGVGRTRRSKGRVRESGTAERDPHPQSGWPEESVTQFGAEPETRMPWRNRITSGGVSATLALKALSAPHSSSQ